MKLSLAGVAGAGIAATALLLGADRAGVLHLRMPPPQAPVVAAPAAAAVVVDANAAQSAGADALPAAGTTGPVRVRITGEVVDSWCQISGIMGIAEGTAHHQCAIWCAVGGAPVGIKGTDGTTYLLLKVGDDDRTVANPTWVDLQTDEVVVEGDLYRRDGVNYLLVAQVLTDHGVVTRNDKELGILPFGE